MVRTNYIDEWQERRKQIRQYYLDRFKHIQPLRCLSEGFETHADSKFVIYSTTERDGIRGWLSSKNIETRIHYETALSELPITDNTSGGAQNNILDSYSGEIVSMNDNEDKKITFDEPFPSANLTSGSDNMDKLSALSYSQL